MIMGMPFISLALCLFDSSLCRLATTRRFQDKLWTDNLDIKGFPRRTPSQIHVLVSFSRLRIRLRISNSGNYVLLASIKALSIRTREYCGLTF
ncbi:hypothetical protein DFH05DRAFT_1479164 [Lentinula detonsa]|uniref:Secreted protein n=1 Tax=Lentinula detonsa TaxID=2804962 RepID=A0A9W8P5D2_9AGAR|nr:hypothetical protein DFH05DRAFT_1479164 [Lentinula detonsa]